MRLGKDLTGKPIYSVTDGRLLGQVKDIYINNDLYWITGIYIGSEGLLKRKSHFIQREHITVFGIDAILVQDSNVVTDDQAVKEAESWIRLSKLRGREFDTPGGTRVATIKDIILGEKAHIEGFTLDRVLVEGPVAERGVVPRDALIDTGNSDGIITIDLPKAENLKMAQPTEEPTAMDMEEEDNNDDDKTADTSEE